MTRSLRVDKNGLRKGPWNKEEDDKLRAYIKRYGHWNWREIPRFAGVSRCGKSCRLRWMNYLRPDIKHGNFTKEEDDLIMKMHNKIGNKWAKIAAELPGRSDNEIKNYWNTNLKKQAKIDQNYPKNMHLETKNQSNFTNSLVESSGLGDNNEVEALWASLSSSEVSFASTHEYPYVTISSPSSSQTCSNDYDDGNFWTDPFFADLDVMVNNVVMAPSDSDEFMWSTMELYSQYHSKFMI
ncbi:hypothetical protein SSX86_005485 [Deinandra increscens subsp. villosa]|uniref:Uncharacterized protein n=1 Tax=Deinandra increscens subsp. villosa TaxID=3103831 RepID=A0AAP0DLL3_9ASTR